MKESQAIEEKFIKEHDLLLKVAAGQIAATPFIANLLRYTESDSGYLTTITIIIFSLIMFFLLLLGKFFAKDILVPTAGTMMLLALFGSILLLIYAVFAVA